MLFMHCVATACIPAEYEEILPCSLSWQILSMHPENTKLEKIKWTNVYPVIYDSEDGNLG